MKTVLHTIDTWGPGGAETVCVELARGLDRSRFHSVAAVVREGWVNDAMRGHVVETTITRLGKRGFDATYMAGLARVVRARRPQLVQTHLLTASLYGGVIARLFGIASVATFHGMVDIQENDRFARVKLRILAASANRLVFVSETLRRHFRETHAIAAHRTTVIPNGIDPERFHPAPNRALRAELGFGDDVFVIIAVGNIRRAKGYDDLLRAAAVVNRTHPHARFVVVGEPSEPLQAQLVALRHELGLEHVVRFLGYRDDVGTLLNGADLCVSSSTSEGFSLTTIQAMACGLPVIVTRSGGPEEIVTDGGDGLLVPVRDPQAMAEAVVALADDVARRSQLGVSGRATVLRRFTLTMMIAAYERLYDELLGGS